MTDTAHKIKIEYGDFQTPLELANKVCKKLVELGITPDIIVEPTCGVGNFLEAALDSFQSANKIWGVEINLDYLNQAQAKAKFINNKKIEIIYGNFFKFDWPSIIGKSNHKILVIGNLPWVTNSQQGSIDGNNLPNKSNFQNYSGLDAITGKSNFDISEWMLIQVVQWLQKREGYLAILCKSSVARKILTYISSQKLHLASCATYKIDTKKYFHATVDACLLLCNFDSNSQNYFCDVFSSLETSNYYRIGYWNNVLVRDIITFEKLQNLYDKKSKIKWRSGIKHDCASVMEFRKINNTLMNGLGEAVDIEETYLFPLLKGSYVAQNKTKVTDRYVLVTQRFVGESIEHIKNYAPKTWDYLEAYSQYLDKRKSKIYQDNPRFSIFGVGLYTFAPWKIAICGLYKKLDFRLIGNIGEKPTVFDDTVYFISFDDEKFAYKTFEILTSSIAKDFYSSLIFWDEKRPIKSSILNKLNLAALAEVLI
ncbi:MULTISPECIES: SAM-dependent methyltransferase [Nostoc]|uniref:SAM-dependent methyltransferase n=1 Tax=Nostoc paludosum FACHB-159 TaxID=2692908 RepID=A0ABR8KIA9_9NOSO|nr:MULTISPECIES: SAM-dependent methyltransferase [Nostoc]MBD2681474.1 SAM-dependent methyltransferase [Nostoc sp. FACHB-857]MBD2737933.1 SAM-dependent methyltransferase [Nostoc paludosum FACHB-159]